MNMQKEKNKGLLTQYIDQMDQTEFDFGQLALKVAEEIAKKMKEKTISKADLAKRLGTSRAYVTNILKGDANLSLKTLAKLQNALEAKFEFSLTTEIEDGISFTARPPKKLIGYFNKDYEKTTPGQSDEDIPIAA